MLTRRHLLRSGALAAGSLALAPAFFRSARAAGPAATGAGAYGPLGPADLNGIRLPAGFRSRVIAQGGQPVLGAAYLMPAFPDGSATFPLPEGGWILVVNAEAPPPFGGASAIRFAPDGRVTAAYRVLEGTDTNCAGGATPWGTWMSCEETGDGRVWECDPTGERPAVAHPAMGVFNHEAVAVDPEHQHLYLTEDEGDGGLYRFTPDAYPDCSKGVLEVAVVAPAGAVRWERVPDPLGGSANPTRKQVAAMTQFKRGEGIHFDDGVVYVATTSDSVVHAYDTRTRSLSRVYDKAATEDPPLINPDNVVVNRSGEIFVGEDDGGDDPLDLCVITPEGEVARFLKLTGAQHGRGEAISEVTGPSFSPDGTRLYVSSQRAFGFGALYEITGPFRTARVPRPRPPAPALGLEIPRTIRKAQLLRGGLPVALTLAAPARVEVRVRAPLGSRAGGRRPVTVARAAQDAPAGTLTLKARPRRRLRKPIRARRKPFRAVVEVRVGDERRTRRVRVR